MIGGREKKQVVARGRCENVEDILKKYNEKLNSHVTVEQQCQA